MFNRVRELERKGKEREKERTEAQRKMQVNYKNRNKFCDFVPENG